MIFNSRRQSTLGQLAQFYGDNPAEADSQLFLNNSQGHGYIQEQARNLGIGDPVRYFSELQIQKQLAATPSGAQMEAARQMGQYSPQSLPGQLAARDRMWNAVGAGEQAQTAKFASLQNANIERSYPLPVPGVTPTLSPVMQRDAASQGFSDPAAYLLNQRLGANRSGVVPFNQISSNGVDPHKLYDEPTFQSAMKSKPDRAAQVFNALTGLPLDEFHKSKLAAAVSETKSGTSDLHEALKEGRAKIVGDKILWRKLVPDPMTGKMGLGADFEEGDPYQKGLSKYLSNVSHDIAKFQSLSAKGGSTATSVAPQVASLQNGQLQHEPSPFPAAPSQTGQAIRGWFDQAVAAPEMLAGHFTNPNDPFLQGINGSVNSVTNAIRGGVNTTMDAGAEMFGFTPPAPQPIIPNINAPLQAPNTQIRAQQMIANPRFRELMVKDPASARRIIMAIHQGGL